jgi:hypothetical protein
MTDGNGWSEYKRVLERYVEGHQDREVACRDSIWREITDVKLRMVRLETKIVGIIGIATLAATAIVQIVARMIGH